ncbi:MAG: DUF86 domain-containing protein [Candidatus Aenigmatarchaeota archaeon]|nr:MAG: DUF86 domain-containing protein [Candidatus Aenigmarchaeota archaeon]
MKNEIINKLERLREYVKILSSYKKCTPQQIKKDVILRGAIERYLQISLECCIDIGEMIISYEGLRKPETYKEIMEILGEKGIIPKKFAKEFAEAIKFRNLLVHMYERIEVERLCNYLKNNLEDFNKFAKFIANYLKK